MEYIGIVRRGEQVGWTASIEGEERNPFGMAHLSSSRSGPSEMGHFGGAYSWVGTCKVVIL